MTNENKQNGSCVCGAVNISIKPENNNVGACHCNMCRKWGGGPLFVFENAGHVQLEGEDNITVYNSSEWAERGFCKKCGSHLFYRLKKEQKYFIPVGLIDDQAHWIFASQVFIDEKPAWYSFGNKTHNLTGAELFAQYTEPSE